MNQRRQKSLQRCRTGNTVASFLLKTLEILENPDYSHILGWASDNVSFMIKNVQQFSKEVLPRYFRHGNFTSFVRQLNMYDFHKVKQEGDSIVFRNELFVRNGQTLLKEIKRKVPKIKKDELREVTSVNSTRRYQRSVSMKTEQDSQFRKLMEAEVNYSSNLFEKAIKYLERTISTRDPWKPLQKELETTNTKEQSTTIIDSLFEVKTKCFNLFRTYETILKEIDFGTDKKLKSLNETVPDSENIKESTEELEKMMERSEHAQKQPQGFKPYSAISFAGKHSTIEQTNIASTPEFNSND